MLLSVSVLLGALGAASADEIRAGARSVLESSSYQKQLPDIANRLPSAEDLLPTSVPAVLSGFATFLLWIGIGVSVIILVVWLVSMAQGRPRPAPSVYAVPTATPAASAAPLPDPEALAAAGRYAEAIHALWLRTLAELSERRSIPLVRSQTGREIASLWPLPEGARADLRALVLAVEHSLFGGRPTGRAEYAASVAHAARLLA